MALVTIRRSASVQSPRKTDETEKASKTAEEDVGSRISRSLNECYFASKGAALVLGGLEHGCPQRRQSPARVPPQPDIQHHLQAMFYLLRPEETLKMAVKLESVHVGRTRYLVVVCRADEAALLGIDCNERTTVGLALRVLADTSIKLDGDGGFSVCVCNRQHIFKPVSVQAMWSALQTLHRASARARELNHFAGGTSHSWCSYYESHVDSDRSCLNEWHAMDSLESRRPPSPDSLRLKPHERDETERVIRCTLKEIMMSVDLDEVTSKVIRVRLEEELDMDLAEYKSFIDQEMLTILGQMDAPTEVFDHVYLGSEWNASNLEELQRNGVRHILNVTREIDNFFPGMFDYLNIRVYDDDKTDLLKHWDNTYKYINKARNEGSKVLVHCKMGISRSASVVIAYAMKAFNWNFDKALKHVKAKRNCIKPNTNFLNQLETYQGILDAMKNKEKLQRSKSETNLKTPKCASRSESVKLAGGGWRRSGVGGTRRSGRGARPRSWSPDTAPPPPPPPTSVSLEHLAAPSRHMLMPCANGSYSVSPNQIIRLKEQVAPRVRHLVHALERRAPPEPDPPPAAPPAETDSGIGAAPADDEAPASRRSSSSSGDSAVVPDLARRGSWAPRRTLSANVRKFNDTCAILRELAAAAAAGSWPERLSASAPPDTWLRGALRRRRAACASHGDLPTGLVSSLKREFEARSEGERTAPRLPRPPTARSTPTCLAPPVPAPCALALPPLDYSDVLVPAVISKAQNKKTLQHGKTHPLTRLNLNRSNNRCSNPVYNTM